jgi:protoheme IX farnesyltransferase
MSKEKTSTNIFSAYVNLLRMRILTMVMVTAAIGYLLAYRGDFNLLRFAAALIGTGLMSGASCALNCYIERDLDALMPRTSNRPLPTGLIKPVHAFIYGIVLLIAGAVLLFSINTLTGFLGLTATFVYLAIYTPAKRFTWLNTTIGALPGAIPPLIGWAAARSELSPGAWILFAMIFLWQHAHFLPIAWLYRSDYAKAGFHMLPVLETRGEKTFLLTVLSALLLLPVSLMLNGLNLTGTAYGVGAAILGILFIASGIRLSYNPSKAAAHAVLLVSILYLPVILASVLIDRYGPQPSTKPAHRLVIR